MKQKLESIAKEISLFFTSDDCLHHTKRFAIGSAALFGGSYLAFQDRGMALAVSIPAWVLYGILHDKYRQYLEKRKESKIKPNKKLF